MGGNRACLIVGPQGLSFKRDLNQTGSQIGLDSQAKTWSLFWDLTQAIGWTGTTFLHSHHCRVVLLNGEKRSHGTLSLNPAFTDWMMGWPIGWTDPLQPVTGWSRWLQQMRGLL